MVAETPASDTRVRKQGNRRAQPYQTPQHQTPGYAAACARHCRETSWHRRTRCPSNKRSRTQRRSLELSKGKCKDSSRCSGTWNLTPKHNRSGTQRRGQSLAEERGGTAVPDTSASSTWVHKDACTEIAERRGGTPVLDTSPSNHRAHDARHTSISLENTTSCVQLRFSNLPREVTLRSTPSKACCMLSAAYNIPVCMFVYQVCIFSPTCTRASLLLLST